MVRNMKKNGFTMPEMIITLGVICVIASILLPVLKNTTTNDKEKKFQKANFLTERIVSEIRADENLYKDENLHTPANDVITDTLFCERFAKRFKIKSEISCTEHSFENGTIPEGSFTTLDGIVWNIPLTTFDHDATIEIDVNGRKGPNCFASEECAEPDRFTITVRAFPEPEPEATPEPEPIVKPTPDYDCSDPDYNDIDQKCGLPLVKPEDEIKLDTGVFSPNGHNKEHSGSDCYGKACHALQHDFNDK